MTGYAQIGGGIILGTAGTATTIQTNITVDSGTTIYIQPNAWQVWTTQTANSVFWEQANETLEQKHARVQKELLALETLIKERNAATIKRTLAKSRARKLLVDHLSKDQRESYEQRGFFYLYTQSGKCYRIDQGTHGNVKLVEDTTKKVLGDYCIQPSGVPDEDAMLAQVLHLTIDEEEFIRRANFRSRRAA